jgi:hypothetical protein
MDETQTDTPIDQFEHDAKPVVTLKEEKASKYRVKPVRQLKSQFLAKRNEMATKQQEATAEQERVKRDEEKRIQLEAVIFIRG